jgi:hypothetical protein
MDVVLFVSAMITPVLHISSSTPHQEQQTSVLQKRKLLPSLRAPLSHHLNNPKPKTNSKQSHLHSTYRTMTNANIPSAL